MCFVTRGASAPVKVWATLDPTDGSVMVAINNKDTSASGVVRLAVPGFSSGIVKRMTAPSFSATRGITLGGQTFDGSTDGKPAGAEARETVNARSGAFETSVKPTGALLLTLRK